MYDRKGRLQRICHKCFNINNNQTKETLFFVFCIAEVFSTLFLTVTLHSQHGSLSDFVISSVRSQHAPLLQTLEGSQFTHRKSQSPQQNLQSYAHLSSSSPSTLSLTLVQLTAVIFFEHPSYVPVSKLLHLQFWNALPSLICKVCSFISSLSLSRPS